MTTETTAPTADEQQAVWDEVAKEVAAEQSPPADTAATQKATDDAADEGAEKAASTSETDVAEKPAADAKPDPYASLSPEVRAKLDKFDQLEQFVLHRDNDLKAAVGRVAAMQREIEAAKLANKVVTDAPSRSEIANAAKSPEKWEQMKADFPDWGEAIDAFVGHRLAALTPAQAPEFDATKLEQMVNERTQEATSKMALNLEKFKVALKHGPEWETTVSSPDFLSWKAAQDINTKQLEHSPRGEDAIRMLDLYVQAKAKPVDAIKDERSSRLAAATTTRPGAATAPKQEADMTPDELWNYMAKQRPKAA